MCVSESNNSIPKVVCELTYADFLAMERMEIACYGAEHTTPAAEAMRWTEKLPESLLVMADARGIAGFINLFPVSDRVLQLLRAGCCNDRDLTADELIPMPPAGSKTHLFLSCILVREDLRGTGLSYRLVSLAMEQYETLCVDTLITDNATAAGRSFSERLGLRPVCRTDYGTEVYEGAYAAAREAAETQDQIMRKPT